MMTIGAVAAGARVNIQTIRYYERRGLLIASGRTAAGYRQYGEDAVNRLRFIKHAQHLGFSLEEIEGLLALAVGELDACGTVERQTREKIQLVKSKIRDLERLARTLERLAASCANREPTDECPILQTLEDHAHTF